MRGRRFLAEVFAEVIRYAGGENRLTAWSPGASWFDGIGEQREMELVSATTYSNGVVGLYYGPRER